MTDPATHPRLAALLAAVLTDPADDAPRLVYADWLEEHGDADDALRGEFIRVQCRLAPMPNAHGNRLYEELRDRERGLLVDHGPAWLATAFGGLSCDFVVPGTPEKLGEVRLGWQDGGRPPFGVEFRRGFVESVTCVADAWLAHADAILAAQPARKVTLTTPPEMGSEGWYEVTTLAHGGRRTWVNTRWRGVTFTLSAGRQARDLVGPGLPLVREPGFLTRPETPDP